METLESQTDCLKAVQPVWQSWNLTIGLLLAREKSQ